MGAAAPGRFRISNCDQGAAAPRVVSGRLARSQRQDVLSWRREFPKDIPQQLNGCDCGVFALLYASFVGAGTAMAFAQADIQHFRVRITNELLDQRAG